MNEFHLSAALYSRIIQSRVCALPQDQCRSNAMQIPQSTSRAKEETLQILKGSSNKRCCVSNMVVYRTTPMFICVLDVSPSILI